MWYEQGTPVAFFVGDPAEPFGADLKRLEEPAYLEGFLPVVNIMYRAKNETYNEEIFAPVDTKLAASGTSFVRFSLARGESSPGTVEARVDPKGPLTATEGALLDKDGNCCVAFSSAWSWDVDRKSLTAHLKGQETAELAIFTKPAKEKLAITGARFDNERNDCINLWNRFLAEGASMKTPETIVNDAWRSMLIGNYMIAVGDRLNYSAGNAYDKLYEGECGDTLRSLMLFGHLDERPQCSGRCCDFDRQATRFHVAGHKLQLLAHYYWVTRDAEYRSRLTSRCGGRRSTSFSPAANRERPAAEGPLRRRHRRASLLAQLERQLLARPARRGRGARRHGRQRRSRRSFATRPPSFRKAILDAVDKSERRDTKPPFIPIALLADEPAHDPLTATRRAATTT